ncbi:MAG: amidohydrolase, partial [Brevundimonas sp.]
AAARERLKIDLALLPFSTGLDALLANPDVKFGTYQGHVKLQGIKFVLDGSVQGRTGYFTRDYKRGSPEGHHPWHGEPILSEAEFTTQARKVHDRGWQLFVHANGDAAIDMAIRGFDALGIKAADDRRPVVIHSQFQRRDQLPAYARIGVGPAYFSNHAWYWGDVHRTNFPAEVVDFISPFRSARAAGLTASNHSDYSVTPLDTRFMLWTSMARVSPTGVVSGAGERLNAYAALQALTTGPAWQAFEENRKGRIKPGLLADFVILDKNPLTTPVGAIKDIKILETIKDGRSAWKPPTSPARP